MKNNKKNITHAEYSINKLLKLDHKNIQTSALLTSHSSGLINTLPAESMHYPNAKDKFANMEDRLPSEQLQVNAGKINYAIPSFNSSIEKVEKVENTNTNKKILPMFINPVNLKKSDDLKKNKLSSKKLNPEKRLTYKNFSLTQILNKKLQKIENYSNNFKNNYNFHSNIDFFTLTGSFH